MKNLKSPQIEVYRDTGPRVREFMQPGLHINNHPYCLHLWRPNKPRRPPKWFSVQKGCQAGARLADRST
jgi:hypothetical protein